MGFLPWYQHGQVKTFGEGDHRFGFLLHPKKMDEKDKNPKRRRNINALSVGLEPTIP